MSRIVLRLTFHLRSGCIAPCVDIHLVAQNEVNTRTYLPLEPKRQLMNCKELLRYLLQITDAVPRGIRDKIPWYVSIALQE